MIVSIVMPSWALFQGHLSFVKFRPRVRVILDQKERTLRWTFLTCLTICSDDDDDVDESESEPDESDAWKKRDDIFFSI